MTPSSDAPASPRAAQPPAYLDAVQVGKPHVEDDHVVRRVLGHPRGIVAQAGDVADDLGGVQGAFDGRRHRDVVLDDQDPEMRPG
ncbi:MAG: hypothetical protein ABIR82_03355 [Nocardioides sp.]